MSQSPSYEVRLSSRASRDLDNLSNDDFTLIDGDILNTPGEKIRDLSVSITVVDGEILYDSSTP